MGISKIDVFNERQNKMASVFKALGHPARIAIIEHLLKVNSCICGDIVNELPLAQATVSQHLKELKNAEIIKGSVEGNSICYCLNPNTISFIKEYLNNITNTLKNQINCC